MCNNIQETFLRHLYIILIEKGQISKYLGDEIMNGIENERKLRGFNLTPEL